LFKFYILELVDGQLASVPTLSSKNNIYKNLSPQELGNKVISIDLENKLKK
jgi:hypothetical protein